MTQWALQSAHRSVREKQSQPWLHDIPELDFLLDGFNVITLSTLQSALSNTAMHHLELRHNTCSLNEGGWHRDPRGAKQYYILIDRRSPACAQHLNKDAEKPLVGFWHAALNLAITLILRRLQAISLLSIGCRHIEAYVALKRRLSSTTKLIFSCLPRQSLSHLWMHYETNILFRKIYVLAQGNSTILVWPIIQITSMEQNETRNLSDLLYFVLLFHITQQPSSAQSYRDGEGPSQATTS